MPQNGQAQTQTIPSLSEWCFKPCLLGHGGSCIQYHSPLMHTTPMHNRAYLAISEEFPHEVMGSCVYPVRLAIMSRRWLGCERNRLAWARTRILTNLGKDIYPSPRGNHQRRSTPQRSCSSVVRVLHFVRTRVPTFEPRQPLCGTACETHDWLWRSLVSESYRLSFHHVQNF